MVFIRSFLAALVLFSYSCLPSACESTWITENGYYIDRRGDIDSPIKPPHPEFIPERSELVQDMTNFETYYKVNTEGMRAAEDKLPIVPNYTVNYSTRKPTIYKKEDYVNVWCDGEKHVGKIDCLTKDSAFSFFPLSAWSRAITTAAWRARGYSQKGVAVLYIEDTAANGSDDMKKALEWANMWGADVRFVSIDAEIPKEWLQ